jgi:hypothetical protein
MSATNFYSGKISAAENERGAASNRRSSGVGFKPSRQGVFPGPARALAIPEGGLLKAGPEADLPVLA